MLGFLFRRKPKEDRRGKAFKRLIVGFIIGSAISSIIGQKLLHREQDEKEEE